MPLILGAEISSITRDPIQNLNHCIFLKAMINNLDFRPVLLCLKSDLMVG